MHGAVSLQVAELLVLYVDGWSGQRYNGDHCPICDDAYGDTILEFSDEDTDKTYYVQFWSYCIKIAPITFRLKPSGHFAPLCGQDVHVVDVFPHSGI